MNHLEKAKEASKEIHNWTEGELGFDPHKIELIKADALIAIAEQQEIQTDRIVNALVIATNSLDRIAEQLEELCIGLAMMGEGAGLIKKKQEDK